MRSADSSGFGRNPSAGLSAIMSREVPLRIRRDQEHALLPASRLGQPARQVEPALVAEVDVDDADVGAQRTRQSHGVVDRGRDTDHLDPLALEQLACGRDEPRTVVHQERAQGHTA